MKARVLHRGEHGICLEAPTLPEVVEMPNERLTAEELKDIAARETGVCLYSYRGHIPHVPISDRERKALLAAAEECERLRAAIERHRDEHLAFSKRTPAGFDQTLWEAIK